MADRGSYTLGPRLDIQQLFLEAQHRWLRPAEICEILRNYQKFQIASEPPSRPPSGSLFLFDRKVLRYFRKDGHNWRKKKDGKTVKEAHEKLKVGSVDVLHCYYAHGEDNESFQRRSYWMLEQQLMHIVFVHYLEVKGNRTNNSPSNSLISSNNREPSGNTDSISSTSPLASFCEDTDSADSQQVNSGRYSFLESQKMQNDPAMGKINAGLLSSQILNPGSGPISYYHGDRLGNNGTGIIEPQDLTSWEEVLEQYGRVDNSLSSHLPTTSGQSSATNIGRNAVLGEISVGGNASKEEFGCSVPMESRLQVPFENISLHLPVGPIDRTVDLDLAYDIDGRLFDHRTHNVDFPTTFEELFSAPIQHDQQFVPNSNANILTHAEPRLQMHANSENDMSAEDSRYTFILKQPLLDGGEALKKVDSFSRWATKELGEVDDLHMRSSSGLSWSTVECGNVVDDSTLSPSLSQDQLFSITDFSPKWAYAESKTEVHICGRFLQSQPEVEKCNWSCMFGEVEVPAEILADGILCCYAPPHNVATVPFYVTSSNRVACSEVREFDYRVGSVEYLDVSYVYGAGSDDMHLYLRFERLLSVRSSSPSNCLFDGARDKQNLVEKIMLLEEEGEGCQVAETTSERCPPQDEFRKMIQKTMQEKLYAFLLHVVAESGKGPSMLDDDGQSVLHLAAALGYDWAVKPIIISGVSINFRDVNGWTGLHWAAFCGREQTVAALVSLGADTRALTDPSPESPLGRTAADLASGNGHKGISGFLAESSLTSYLHLLTLSDKNEGGGADASGLSDVQTISERMATPVSDGDVPTALSFKDTLTAMRNATQAANRIYQVFRMQSFQRKQLTEYEDDEIETLDPRALALLAAKAPKPVHSDGVVHAAATQIQKKYRGWKKRKEFLIIRQRIVKIQAHVRGHQVRKQYKTVIWSVGILEKVILRWRRKGSGLRGFRRDALPSPRESSVQFEPSKEDDYDFLKEGRKQNEVRQQKALTRVKSMYHSSEGQAQYRRLLNYFEKFRENKGTDTVVSSPNEMAYREEDLIDIDSLLDDDTFMSIAFE